MAHKNKSILLIDDDEEMLNTLEHLFISLSCKIFKATNSNQAIRLALKLKPSVILLDLDLNTESGYDVLARIRSEPNLSIVPVIIVSGYSEGNEIIRSIENGADDYIEKPFNSKILLYKIKNLLRINRVEWYIRDNERAKIISESLTFGLIELDQNFNILWLNRIANELLSINEANLATKNLKEVFANQKIVCKENKSLDYLTEENNIDCVICHLPEQANGNAGLYSLECINTKRGYSSSTFLLKLLSIDKEIKNHSTINLFEHYVAHKLNTPINQILMPLQLLEAEESVNEESKDLIHTALDATTELNQKVKSLLTYIDRKNNFKECVQTITLKELIDSIHNFYKKVMINYEIFFDQVEYESKLAVTIDIVHMILSEVTLNSQKFCNAEKLKINILIENKDENKITMTIFDNGSLASSESIVNCILPYKQMSLYGLAHEKGMGVGLSSLRYTLWNINGDIKVIPPEQDRGFTIQITLDKR